MSKCLSPTNLDFRPNHANVNNPTMLCTVQGRSIVYMPCIVEFTRLAENSPTAAMMHCIVQGRSIVFMQKNTNAAVEFTWLLSPFQVTSTSRW